MKRFIEIISKVALLSRVVWPKNTSSPTSVTSSTNRRKKNIVSLVSKNLNILFWSSEVAVFNSKQIRQGCYCSRKLSPMEFNGVSKKVFWTFSYLYLWHTICMSAGKFFLAACCGLNFDATNLPNSSLEPLYPKLFRGRPEVDLVSTVWPPDLPKVRWCRFLLFRTK